MCIALSKNSKEKLHDWMYTLLYPATLGTLVVTLLFGWSRGGVASNYNLLFAIFLIFYFCSQHVVNVSDKKCYTGWEFFFDFLELLLMVPLLSLLGFYDKSIHLPVFDSYPVISFQVLLAITFLLPILARVLSGKYTIDFKTDKKSWMSLLSLIAIILALAGICWDRSWFILSLLYIVFLFYLVGFVFEALKGKLYE